MTAATQTLRCLAFCFCFVLSFNARRIEAQPANSTYEVGGLEYVTYSSYWASRITAQAIQTSCSSGAPPFPITELTITAAHEAFLNGSLTCSQLVAAYVQRISAYDDIINSVSFINPNLVTESAAMDQMLQEYKAAGTPLPYLFCVPMIFKDNYDVINLPSTAGAVAFEDNFPYTDGVPAAKLKAQGAIVLAKGTMSEFAQSAMHSVGSQFGIVRNPYALDKTTGGSSGGPAAATAANLAMISMGTDTGSSIRTPAAFQSLVGIRPTIGLNSRKGVVPLDYYRDSVGPLGRTVTDVALVFQALPGPDPADGLTGLIETLNATLEDNYTQYLNTDGLQGKRIGVWTQLATRTNYSTDIYNLFEQAAADMEQAGAELVFNVTLKGNSLGDKDWDPNPKYEGAAVNSGIQRWYTGYGSEGQWETIQGLCAYFKEVLEPYLATAGTRYKTFAQMYYDGLIHPSSIEYFAGDLNSYNHTATFPPAGSGLVCKCTDWTDDPCQGEYAKRYIQMLDDNDLDAVIYPVHGSDPTTIGAFTPDFIRNTYVAPQTGTPAITVPMGFTQNGYPAGLMIGARHFDEATLFEAAYAYEQATLHRRPTPLFPECDDGPGYIPYSQVLSQSSDTPSPAGQPASDPYPSLRKRMMLETAASA